MDAIDRHILTILRTEGRISMHDLGDRISLSPTPTARRVRTLERDGIIRGYQARVDEAKTGQGCSVFVSIRLAEQKRETLNAFERAIADMPEVADCWLMTGARDYLLRVAVADLQGFEQFLNAKLTVAPGVATIESSVPIREVKRA
ncbi:MAG: Lrp/AsnC family transcriptional regulator [Pseudomonadota bacterium]